MDIYNEKKMKTKHLIQLSEILCSKHAKHFLTKKLKNILVDDKRFKSHVTLIFHKLMVLSSIDISESKCQLKNIYNKCSKSWLGLRSDEAQIIVFFRRIILISFIYLIGFLLYIYYFIFLNKLFINIM